MARRQPRGKLKPHKQVMAKVNACVDENMKELVEILNSFDGVRTTESCQKDADGLAYVYFTYGSDSRRYGDYRDYSCVDTSRSPARFVEMAKFAHRLASRYSKAAIEENEASRRSSNDLGVGMSLYMAIDWVGCRRTPYLRLSVPHKLLKQVTRVFARLKTENGEHKAGKRRPHPPC